MKNTTKTRIAPTLGIAFFITLAMVISMAVLPLTGCSNPTSSSGGKTLVSIAVDPLPKTQYNLGDEFDPTDMKVTAYYSDGSDKELKASDYALDSSKYKKDTAGEYEITVTYQKKTATFKVTVFDGSVISIAITKEPTKLIYFVGDDLDLAGLEVTATKNTGAKEVVTITSANISGYDKTKDGDQIVTVTYQTRVATFVVTVNTRPIVADVTVSPASGTYVPIGEKITLRIATDGAEIWYTLDGSDPAKNGATSTKYSDPITLTKLPATVKAIGVKDDWTDSEILEATYPGTPITEADVSIVVPANGATPATSTMDDTESEFFTAGTVTWIPNVPHFLS